MWIIKIIKIKCFYPPWIVNKHWCIHSCLQIPPRVYATAINFPCIITLALKYRLGWFLWSENKNFAWCNIRNLIDNTIFQWHKFTFLWSIYNVKNPERLEGNKLQKMQKSKRCLWSCSPIKLRFLFVCEKGLFSMLVNERGGLSMKYFALKCRFNLQNVLEM